MDERRHLTSAKPPGMFNTLCGIQGDYIVISWANVTCDNCLKTLSPEKRKALEEYKSRNFPKGK